MNMTSGIITLSSEQISKIAHFVRENKKIPAIKELRTHARCSLRTAKEIMDRYDFPFKAQGKKAEKRSEEAAERFSIDMASMEFINDEIFQTAMSTLVKRYGCKAIISYLARHMEDDCKSAWQKKEGKF